MDSVMKGYSWQVYPLVSCTVKNQHDEDRYLLTLQVSIAASASTWALHGAMARPCLCTVQKMS
jgi:hypothetical protein